MRHSVDKEANGVENKAEWDATGSVDNARRWDGILLEAG
jgi:hypothetical protein